MSEEPSLDTSGRLLAQERRGDNAPPLSVSELAGALKRTVEDRFGRVRVRGEISGFKRAGSGHCYFCVKDEKAVLDAVMWRGTASAMTFAAEDGLDVVATGKITTYPGRSKYQIVVDQLELAGEGALMQLFERLKARLAAEGLFDADNKRPIPVLPRTIGIVTSPTGAVIRDMIHRISDRFPVHVLVWPVRVQGDGAKDEIAGAIEGFSTLPDDGPVPRPDIVIVARGGGSIEDLWAFNEEVVVRAIVGSSIPVISAVGHETDTTLADHAADWRAPTPTAAAEKAVPVRLDLLAHLEGQKLRLSNALRRNLSLAAERLAVQARLMPDGEALLAQPQQRLDEMGERLRRGLDGRAVQAERRLSAATGALRLPMLHALVARKQDRLDALRLSPDMLRQRLGDRERRLASASRLLESLHPDRPLQRGYARVSDRKGQTITTAAQARATGSLRLHFADAEVDATVDEGEAHGAPPPPPPPPRRSPSRPRPPVAGQGDLFGGGKVDAGPSND